MKVVYQTIFSGMTRRTTVGNTRVAMWANRLSGTRGFSSVSQSEVGKFSDLSKSWWDPRKNPLIGMNSIRMEYIVQQVNSQTSGATGAVAVSPLAGKKALDVGCGGGLLSESLARLGADVTGVDPSQELVEAAKLHGSLHPLTRNIDYRGGWSVEQLAASIEKEEDKYDVVCLLEVLEHVTDVDSVISSIHQLLKPDGKLFLSTMNRTVKSHLVAILGAEYIMGYLPPGTHDWNEFRSPKEVQAILQRNGFEQEHVTGMVIPVTSPPLFGNWNWKFDPNDTDINWIGTYHKSS